jgi:hypothetical protein
MDVENTFRQSLADLLVMLKERQIRDIIAHLTHGNKILPAIDTDSGMIYYTVNDMKLDLPLIDSLIGSGLIKDSGSSSLASCPVCGNMEFNVELVCPTHNVTLQKEEIYEEPRTGFIGTIDKFISKDSKVLVSPVDKKEITRSSLTKRSYWFRCSVGGEVVNNPKVVLHCLKGHDFEIVQANIVEIHHFVPDESKLKFAVDYIKFFEFLSAFMAERGYKEADNRLAGASRVLYALDAVYRKDTEILALSVMNGGNSSLMGVLSMLPEIYDLKQVSNIYFTVVFIPSVGLDVISVLERYGVKVISANSFEEAAEALKQNITETNQQKIDTH